MMSELRELGGHAAAVLPLPAGPVALEATGADNAGRAVELLAGVKQQAADLVTGAKQHAARAYVRMADPTPLAGARPGALATVVAGCIAAGGGAYCAVEGVPGSFKPVLGIERPAEQAEQKPRQAPKAEPSPPQVPPQVAPAPAPQAPAPAPAAPREPQRPPPAPENEFEPAPGPASPEPAAPAQAAPAPASPAPARAGEGIRRPMSPSDLNRRNAK